MHVKIPAVPRPRAERNFHAGRALILGALLGALSAPLGRAAPGNDNLATATTLVPALPLNVAGNNTGATLEVNEWNFGGSSVWYSWTPLSSGWVAIDTFAGNGTAQLDTVVGVYTGLTQATLELAGFNDEAWGDATHASKLAFYAVAGTAYHLAVFGYDDGTTVAEGAFTLHLTSAAPEVRVTAFFISPASVDVSTAPQTVDLTVSLNSDADLFTIADPYFLLRSPGGWTTDSLLPVLFSSTDLFSGNATSGTYKKTVTIPQGITPGAWIPSMQIDTSSGTNIWSLSGQGAYQDHWIINGSTQLLTVKSGAIDLDPPALTAFSSSPASAVPYEKVTANLTITDAGGSGFQQADIWLANGGAWLAGVTAADRVSGNASSGSYAISFAVPSNLVQGSYPFEISLADAAANWSGYNGTATGDILASHPLVVGTDSIIDGWRRQHFGSTGNTEAAANSADPDKDGIVNLLEFATNHDPNAPDSGVTSVTSAGGVLTLSYSRTLAAVAAGVQFFAEWSDSPGGPWSMTGVTESVTASDAEADRVQASVSLGSSPHRFMRLRAFLPAP
jgi:hypothetical protein